MKMTVEEAISRANTMGRSGDYHINAGVERRAVAKEWKGERQYINLYCYSLAGNYKGKYDCGYIDIQSGEYIANKYTEIDLEKMVWAGR